MIHRQIQMKIVHYHDDDHHHLDNETILRIFSQALYYYCFIVLNMTGLLLAACLGRVSHAIAVVLFLTQNLKCWHGKCDRV